MLEGILGYAANAAIGAAGAGLVLLHRGTFHYDNQRKVNVADGNGLSAKIINLFPRYRYLSPAIDHIVQGVCFPYAVGGAVGFGNLLLGNILGADSDTLFRLFNPNMIYPLAWLVASGAAVTSAIYFTQGRKTDMSDFLQSASDIASILVSGYLILGRHWL